MKFIPYSRQLIDGQDRKLVSKSLHGDLITTGPIVEKFELNIKKYLSCKYSYVCSSGTAAIHLAMLSLNLKKNDVILMPSINFIASYNIANILGLKIFLVDVDELTGQITPEKVLECIKNNKLKKIHALIVMYLGGYPENIANLYSLKKRYNFFIIEDACHALGAEYKFRKKNYKVGACKHADISTFSLHPQKTITSGEGGVITTNTAKVAKNIKLYRNHGILRNKKKHWQYDVIKHGLNYRLSDLNCALGLSQLKKINHFINKRKLIYYKYYNQLKNFHHCLEIPHYSIDNKSSFHLFLININFNKLKGNKNNFIKYLHNNKIISQQHYIPIYVGLNQSKQDKVIKIIKSYFLN